jgi:hypothetical protein
LSTKNFNNNTAYLVSMNRLEKREKVGNIWSSSDHSDSYVYFISSCLRLVLICFETDVPRMVVVSSVSIGQIVESLSAHLPHFMPLLPSG